MKAEDYDFAITAQSISFEGHEMILTKEYETSRCAPPIQEMKLTARRYVSAQHPHTFQAVFLFNPDGCQFIETGYSLPYAEDLEIIGGILAL